MKYTEIYNKGKKLNVKLMAAIKKMGDRIDNGETHLKKAYCNMCDERLILSSALYNHEYKKIENIIKNSPLM